MRNYLSVAIANPTNQMDDALIEYTNRMHEHNDQLIDIKVWFVSIFETDV